MPFEIVNGGIEREETDVSALRPAFRTRTRLIQHVPELNKSRVQEISSHGRDAVINKPYKPLGSMESVLTLRVERRQPGLSDHGAQTHANNASTSPSSPGASTRPRRGTGSHIESGDARGPAGALIGPASALIGPASETPECALVALDDVDMRAKLWALRHGPTSKDGPHGVRSHGYDAILAKLREANRKIDIVRAGGSVLSEARRHEPLACAQFASSRAERLAKHKAAARHDANLAAPAAQSQAIGKRISTLVPTRPAGGPFSSSARNPHRSSVSSHRRTSAKASSGGHAARSATNGQSTVADRLEEGFEAIALRSQPRKIGTDRSLPRHAGERPETLAHQASRRHRRGSSTSVDAGKGHRPADVPAKHAHAAQDSESGGSDGGPGSGPAPGTSLGDHAGPQIGAGAEQERRRSSIYGKDVMDKAKALGEKQRRRLPSYVLCFPRKTQLEKSSKTPGGDLGLVGQQHQFAAAAAVAAAAAAASSAGLHDTSGMNSKAPPSLASAGLSPEATLLSAREAPGSAEMHGNTMLQSAQVKVALQRLRRLEAHHEQILKRIQRSTLQSRKLQDAIVQRSREFFETKALQQDRLLQRMSDADFERANEVRRKFIALDLALHPRGSSFAAANAKVRQPDAQKQLQEIRQTARELRTLQVRHNMESSVWFRTLLATRGDSTTPLSLVEQKLLAALRKLVIEGFPLTKDLFFSVLLHVMDKRDHFLAPFQRLVTIIRINVLRIDPLEYHAFLEKHQLHVPQSLLDSIESVKKMGAGTGSELHSGIRAAALAMRWKARAKRSSALRALRARHR